MTLSEGRFERNAASLRGGGVNYGGAAVVNGTQFISNTCGGGIGGGLYVGGAAVVNEHDLHQ